MPARTVRQSILLLFCLLPVVELGHAQTPLGDYTDHEITSTSVTVWADSSGLRVRAYRPEVLRIDLLPNRSTTHDSSLVVVRDPASNLKFDVEETADVLTISTSGLTARIQKKPVRLHVQKGGTTVLKEPEAAGFMAKGDQRQAQFDLPPQMRFYGTGERGLGINLRGERFRSYNQSIYGYDQPQPTMNINVPLLLTSQGYALLFDDPYPGTFDLGARNGSRFSYEAEGGELSYYVLAGEDIPAQLKQYTWLTGRPPMPPKWALGFLQSKYGYQSRQAAREVVNQLRENDIPADGLILDLYWFEHMGDLRWNQSAFPAPSQMIENFEAQGVKTLVITEPYFTEPSRWFSETVEPGTPRAVMNHDGTAYRVPEWFTCGPCDAVLSDLTHAPTRAWWKDRYRDILSSGVHGLWTDLGEPEVHPSETEHVAGPADAVHNIYNLLWARIVHEVFSEQRPNRRLVNLTRSGYAGIQRYGVFTWSADVARTFDGLAVQRPILLNSTLSGLYYHSSDLGGFTGTTSPELYARWMQLGAFTPVARAHGVDNQPTEPWRISPPAPSISRRYIKLRYRLLPYLYTMAYRAYDRGMPIIRPLFFETEGDRFAEEDNAYLFGDSFLVAPVVEPNKVRKDVPLPPGTWINYWTDEAVRGNQTVTVDAPLGRLPLFVRQGAIIPMRPTAPDYVGHSVPDTLELVVYPSDNGGQFTLYEDDGHTRAYRQGAYTQTTFAHRFTTTKSDSALQVTLGAAQGTFEAHPSRRTYSVVVPRVFQRPEQVTIDGRSLPNRKTVRNLHQQSAGYAYDPATRRLHVQLEASTQTEHHLQIQGVQPAGVGAANVNSYALEPPAPHPVRGSASISFQLQHRSRVTLAIYDVLGRRVTTLINERRRKGPYTVSISPQELGLSSGVYFYRLTARSAVGTGDLAQTHFQKTRKMVIMR